MCRIDDDALARIEHELDLTEARLQEVAKRLSWLAPPWRRDPSGTRPGRRRPSRSPATGLEIAADLGGAVESRTPVFAWMFPFTSPWTTMVPQVMFASMRRGSPTTGRRCDIVPTKLASMRTVPAKVSLPSNSHSAGRAAGQWPPAGIAGASSRFGVASRSLASAAGPRPRLLGDGLSAVVLDLHDASLAGGSERAGARATARFPPYAWPPVPIPITDRCEARPARRYRKAASGNGISPRPRRVRSRWPKSAAPGRIVKSSSRRPRAVVGRQLPRGLRRSGAPNGGRESCAPPPFWCAGRTRPAPRIRASGVVRVSRRSISSRCRRRPRRLSIHRLAPGARRSPWPRTSRARGASLPLAAGSAAGTTPAQTCTNRREPSREVMSSPSPDLVGSGRLRLYGSKRLPAPSPAGTAAPPPRLAGARRAGFSRRKARGEPEAASR